VCVLGYETHVDNEDSVENVMNAGRHVISEKTVECKRAIPKQQVCKLVF